MSSWNPGAVPGRHPGIKIGDRDSVPQRVLYSQAIEILSREGQRRLNDAQPIQGEPARNFLNAVRRALAMLETLPTGAALLGEIAASNHKLYIFKGVDNSADGSCVVPYPGDIRSSEGRFIKPLRPPGKYKQDAMIQQNVWLPAMQTYTLELKRLIERAGQKNPALNKSTIASIVGVPPNWIDEMIAGKRPLEDDEYYRLVLYLYEYLEPGAGSDAEMRVVLTQEELPNDPLWIVIAHELVHAWRIMNGRRIFEGGWEEEAMTTGIPPFTSMKFTENRLRVEGKLPPRPNYDTGLCKTTLLHTVRYLYVQPPRKDRPFAAADIAPRNS
jgi:hypothetical protein